MASSAGLRKQNSARDKTKLSPDLGQPAFKKSTHHLVVCGAENAVKDIWLFGDFLGFVDALKKSNPPINGHFVNCYPVGEYFNTTGLKDIKFGRRKEMGDNGWDSDYQIAIYTRWQYEHRELWWEQVRRELWPTAKDEVLRWMENKAQDAKPGSIVTIILIGHGDENGIYIGGKPLNPSNLAAVCAKFQTNVQINLVIKACSSGAFAKAFRIVGLTNLYLHTSSKDEAEKSYSDRRSVSGRLRNSLFGAAFVETLGLMKDEDEIWTLEKQKQKVEAGVSGPLVPPAKISHPQVVSDSSAKRLMWDILSRDYVDVSFNQASTNARRVLTPSNHALRSLSSTSHPPMQSYTAAEVILSEEMGLIDTNYSEPADVGVTEMYFSLQKFPKGKKLEVLRDLIVVLKYRFNLQERVFIVAESFMALGLLSYKAIVMPMGLSQPTNSVSAVMDGLRCFECLERATNVNEGGFGITFDAPVMWLATVIVRSCTDWTRILDLLVTIPILGPLNRTRATQVCVRRPRFTINPNEAQVEDVISPEFGFWLPHGLPIGVFIDTFMSRYSRIRDISQELEGEATWEDNPLFYAALERILAISSGRSL